MRAKVILSLSLGLVVSCLGGYLLARGDTIPVMQEPIYSGPPDVPSIALTVNVDWGEEHIPALLAVSKKERVPLTFFITGRWAEKFPALVRQIDQAGHEIGNHAYSHAHPDRLSVEENLDEIEKTAASLARITGRRTTIYAPPYGEHGSAVLEAATAANHKTILWTIDGLDWQHPPPDQIVARVLNRVCNGAIVLLHPTEATVKALPVIVTGLRQRGFQLVTVSQMLEK